MTAFSSVERRLWKHQSKANRPQKSDSGNWWKQFQRKKKNIPEEKNYKQKHQVIQAERNVSVRSINGRQEIITDYSGCIKSSSLIQEGGATTTKRKKRRRTLLRTKTTRTSRMTPIPPHNWSSTIHRITQNHWMPGAGIELWRSSSQSPLIEQYHLDSVQELCKPKRRQGSLKSQCV